MAAAAGPTGPEVDPVAQETHKLKHSKIVVWVEEALQDLLVVSFVYGTVSFQGVLLHSSRKKWPYGLMAPNLTSYTSADKQTDDNSTSQQPAEADDDDNKLFAVSQRFSYLENNLNNFQQQQPPKCTSLLPVASKVSNRRFDRNTRTMRLRPRQVLCSKCKSICNENSENVEESNASRRESEVGKTGNNYQVFQNQRNSRKLEAVNMTAKVKNESSCDKMTAINCANKNYTNPSTNSNNNNRKRALDSSTTETEKNNKQVKMLTSEVLSKQNHMAKTTPFIKISFGPQGTIVKIPPRTRTYTASDTDAEGGTTPPQVQIAVSPSHSSVAAKAAKKALKKAKKEARRKMSYPNSSPLAHLEIQKQRHHKHKFKHKRRHKENQEREQNNREDEEDVDGDENEMMSRGKNKIIVNGETENWDCNNIVRVVNDGLVTNNDNVTQYNDIIKKECLKQKLSISLKRLNEKSYTKCSSSSSGNSSNSEDSNSSSNNKSNSEVEEVPEFPANEMSEREIRPLMMRIISHGVEQCTLEDGRTMSVGDIVWGKIHGFPWWPGKVLSITVSQRDNGILINQQAHVAWFGSSTSSCMPCRHLVPFLEDFQSRYNKKKRGPYKEAIKQAIRAAQLVQSNGMCDLSVQTVI